MTALDLETAAALKDLEARLARRKRGRVEATFERLDGCLAAYRFAESDMLEAEVERVMREKPRKRTRQGRGR